MYSLARRLLFLLPAESAHRLTLGALHALAPARGLVRSVYAPAELPRLQSQLWGLNFNHPIGLAAGLDKDAEAVAMFAAMGFAFVEVGTVTPRPQPGNPQPRLFRLPLDEALINRMGFNNQGAAAMALRLGARSEPSGCPLGINLGKNKDTPLEAAAGDYLLGLQALYDIGDYFVVNVSSPNTPGLRDLQTTEALGAIVRPLLAERDSRPKRKPILVKLSVDLAVEDAAALAQACARWGVDGLVAANTTLSREGLRSPSHLSDQPGGLSGKPLLEASTRLIRALAAASKLPIIGVGGVFTAEDAYAKIRAGASLIQIYTGFIYGGPATPGRLARGLDRLLERDGCARLADAIGVDLRGA